MEKILNKIIDFIRYINNRSFPKNVFMQADSGKHLNANLKHLWIKCKEEDKVFYIRLTEWEYEKAKKLAFKNPEDQPK